MKEHQVITALHKFYDVEDYVSRKDKLDNNYFMVSTGITDRDYEKLQNILEVIDIKWICIDVANGYMEKLVKFCNKVRENYPDKILVAGNVVSREMTEELILMVKLI